MIDLSNKQGHELEFVCEQALGGQSEPKALDTWQCKRCKKFWRSVRRTGPGIDREAETDLGLRDVKDYLDVDDCAAPVKILERIDALLAGLHGAGEEPVELQMSPELLKEYLAEASAPGRANNVVTLHDEAASGVPSRGVGFPLRPMSGMEPGTMAFVSRKRR